MTGQVYQCDCLHVRYGVGLLIAMLSFWKGTQYIHRHQLALGSQLTEADVVHKIWSCIPPISDLWRGK